MAMRMSSWTWGLHFINWREEDMMSDDVWTERESLGIESRCREEMSCLMYTSVMTERLRDEEVLEVQSRRR